MILFFFFFLSGSDWAKLEWAIVFPLRQGAVNRLIEHNARLTIIVNTIEKRNEQTHNLLRELIQERMQQSKVNLEINDKTSNAIPTNSKETGQLLLKF